MKSREIRCSKQFRRQPELVASSDELRSLEMVPEQLIATKCEGVAAGSNWKKGTPDAPTEVAFDSGVSFQLAVFAQETVARGSWKLTPRLLSGASRVPILRQAGYRRIFSLRCDHSASTRWAAVWTSGDPSFANRVRLSRISSDCASRSGTSRMARRCSDGSP
jgi:hypothetical protein